HRSNQLNIVIFALSLFFSDSALSLVLRQLGIMVSRESIRQLLSHIEIKDEPDIDAVGIDDVCLKKGQSYYTVIYDAHDHHLLALLNGRDGKELKKWLKNHPCIRTVARDRASAYASAVAEILPDCMQVADRFHLLLNLLERLRKILQEELPNTIFIQDEEILDHKPEKEYARVQYDRSVLESLHYDNTPPVDEQGQIIPYIDKSESRTTTRYLLRDEARKKKYQLVKEIRAVWKQDRHIKKKELEKRYHVSNMTLRKYLNMSEEEVEKLLEITPYKKRDTPVNSYLNIIYKMLRDHVKPSLIYAYIVYSGYEGSGRSLEHHIEAIEANNFGKTLSKSWNVKAQYPKTIEEIKRSDTLKFITITDKEKMKNTKVAMYYPKLKEKFPVIEKCETIWKSFHEIIIGKDPEKIDEFIEENKKTKSKGFIEGLKKDIAAVKNTISSPISSGFVEGGNDRYKLVKRMMFGRAGQMHLFEKTYAISIIMRTGIKASQLIENRLHEDGRIKRKEGILCDTF
ncbi:transposase, partial [uncultured Dubosiella sp.]|uniref:transposase n=1 Tax=uncultured Dubosiella sp. TaxID=1937011 RepID=UPI002608516D